MSISSCQVGRQTTMSMPVGLNHGNGKQKNLAERNKMIEEKPITLSVFSHAQDYEHILLLGLNKIERKNPDEA